MGACVGVVVGVVVGVCVGVRDRDAPADADAEKAETGVSREDVAASAARDGNAPAESHAASADADTIETGVSRPIADVEPGVASSSRRAS